MANTDTVGAVLALRQAVSRLASAETLADKAYPLREIRKAFDWLEKDLTQLRLGADAQRSERLRKAYEESDDTEALKEELWDYLCNRPDKAWSGFSRDNLLCSEDLFEIAHHIAFDASSALDECEVVGQGKEGTGYVYDLLREADELISQGVTRILFAAHQVEIEETACKCGRFHDYPPEECEGWKS